MSGEESSLDDELAVDAACMRFEFGAASAGLPAETKSARSWPRPGVSTSSGITPIGSHSKTRRKPPMRETLWSMALPCG